MPSVERRAAKILDEYGAAQSELIGKAVVLSDGKAGTVENVWLDELHVAGPRAAQQARSFQNIPIKASSFQNIPIKAKRPISIRKAVDMMATEATRRLPVQRS